MLFNASEIKGYAIAASDGNIGTVTDLLFDDAGWLVRWLVIETGNWLSGRKVLLPTSTLGHANSSRHEFSAKLTMQQVKDSPNIDTERPVSRQMETNIYGHYGWNLYWGSSTFMDDSGRPMAALPTPESRRYEQDKLEAERATDPHLHSINAVEGYHIQASDGGIGHVEDFLIEEADWSIHYLVVDTRNWWPGKKVLISPRSARNVSWTDRTIDVNVDRNTVKSSPTYDASTTVDRDYEDHFNSYYGGVGPSAEPDHTSKSA